MAPHFELLIMEDTVNADRPAEASQFQDADRLAYRMALHCALKTRCATNT